MTLNVNFYHQVGNGAGFYDHMVERWTTFTVGRDRMCPRLCGDVFGLFKYIRARLATPVAGGVPAVSRLLLY